MPGTGPAGAPPSEVRTAFYQHLLGRFTQYDILALPTAQVWHLGLFRDERTLRPVEYYNKLPDQATVDMCLILDPMLATGGSATAAIEVLKHWGATRIKLINLIAAPEGVRAVVKAHPDVSIHVAALDRQLNEKGYIMPGLGDAGDRQFGTGHS